MKSAVETLEPTKVKLTVEVTHDELKPYLEHAYKHIGEQIQVPGFRRGKVPPRIVDQRVGHGAVLEHAINDSLGAFYGQAVEAEKLQPMARPEVEVTSVPEPGDAEGVLTFVAQVEIRPEVPLPDLADVVVAVEGAEVTEEDVDAQMDSLRERFGTLVGVDRAAQEGDFVVLDLKATQGETEIDSVSGVSYQIGTGTMIDGLDEALTGLSAGETTTFDAPLAGGEHEGENSLITVTAQSVKQRELPEVDDEFAELASEFDTVEELREDLRVSAARSKATAQAVEAQNALLDRLLSESDFPLPAGALAEQVASRVESEGLADDDAEAREALSQDTAQQMRTQLLLDALAEKLEVQVDQPELVEYLIRTASQYGMEPDEFVKALESAGQIPQVVAEVARSKALTTALRRVRVVGPGGALVDLTPVIGPDPAVAAAMAQMQGQSPVRDVADDATDISMDVSPGETVDLGLDGGMQTIDILTDDGDVEVLDVVTDTTVQTVDIPLEQGEGESAPEDRGQEG